MDDFLQRHLDLKFHPRKKCINTTDKGINFVGYIVRHYCKYVRRSTINGMCKTMKHINDPPKLRASLNSYLGIVKHADCVDEKKRICGLFAAKGVKFNDVFTKMILD